jgi:cytoskeletal protein CcmA (bactofilin family)
VVVQGIIQGDVIAHNSVTVLPGGVIEGNVSSNSINVDSKANVRGNIKKTASAEATHVSSNGQLQKVAVNDSAPKRKEMIPSKPNVNASSDEDAPKPSFW